MTQIEFIDPPHNPRMRIRPAFWAEVIAQLQARPGEWARVQIGVGRTAGHQRAKRIRSGEMPLFRDGKYDAYFATDESGTNGDLYVRAIP